MMSAMGYLREVDGSASGMTAIVAGIAHGPEVNETAVEKSTSNSGNLGIVQLDGLKNFFRWLEMLFHGSPPEVCLGCEDKPMKLSSCPRRMVPRGILYSPYTAWIPERTLRRG